MKHAYASVRAKPVNALQHYVLFSHYSTQFYAVQSIGDR